MMTKPYSGLNTNKARKEFWEAVAGEKGNLWMEKALGFIDPVSARVLTWHYIDRYSLVEITTHLNRSISIVRNHHSRGIFQLQQYYLKTQFTDQAASVNLISRQ